MPRYLFSRRQLLAAVPGLILLAACGGDDDDDDADTDSTPTQAASAPTNTPGASPAATNTPAAAASTNSPAAVATATTSADAAFTFTDDRGKTISLPDVPERIVASVPSAASLWDFGVRPIAVYGPLVKADGTPEPSAGSIDPDAVDSVGEVFDEVDIEKLLSLNPDLLVGTMYFPDELYGIQDDAEPRLEELVPTVGILTAAEPVTVPIQRFEELAVALGADVNAPDVLAAKARFEAASEAVKTAAAAKAGLKVLFLSAYEAAIYVANPPAWGDLLYFQELGVELVVPEVPAENYFEELSWEQATKYDADLILNDFRGGGYTNAEFVEQPTAALHPAVQAGQVGEWIAAYAYTYSGFAGVLEALAETIESARADVV
jgi:iron complex transport system substrate-binding protein